MREDQLASTLFTDNERSLLRHLLDTAIADPELFGATKDNNVKAVFVQTILRMKAKVKT